MSSGVLLLELRRDAAACTRIHAVEAAVISDNAMP
jgi:hypothetical protein